jgi:hypothetical protein
LYDNTYCSIMYVHTMYILLCNINITTIIHDIQYYVQYIHTYIHTYICTYCNVQYVQSFAFKLRALRSTFLYISIGFLLATVAFYMKKTVQYISVLQYIYDIYYDYKINFYFLYHAELYKLCAVHTYSMHNIFICINYT